MVSLVEIQTIYYMVAATGVLVAAVYYIFNIRQSIKNRKAQLFTQATSVINQREWMIDAIGLLNQHWTDFDDFAKKYDSGINPENFAKRSVHFNVMENLGYYVKTGQLDLEQANTVLGGFYPVWLWLKYEDVIKSYRNVLSLPYYLENFEYLADELMELNKRRGHPITFNGSEGSYTPSN
jgi:hypothetical protein